MKILMIMKDDEMLEGVSLSFRLRWPQAILVSSAEGYRGIEMVETESPEVVLLDMTLPDMDGFEVLSQIRTFSNVPLIVVTGRGEEIERVRGLELGADDYVVKPFSYMELLARVRAVLRRAELATALPTHPHFTCSHFHISFAQRQVIVAGNKVELTPTEYNLLQELVLNTGKVMTHMQLLQKVWGPDYRDEKEYLHEFVRRLRNKLEPEKANPRYIISVPGVGYQFKVDE